MKFYNKPLAEIIDAQKNMEEFCISVSVAEPVYENPGYAQADSLVDDFGEG